MLSSIDATHHSTTHDYTAHYEAILEEAAK